MSRTAKLPRGISMDPHGMFRARLSYHGKSYQIGQYFTLGDAQAALAIARSQVARDTFVPVPQRRETRRLARAAEDAQAVTVRAWSEEWLQGLEKAGRSPSTVTSYRSTLRSHVLPICGDLRLVDVKPATIDSLVVGKSDSVKFNVLRCTSSMFRAAVKAKSGGITTSPVTQAPGALAKRLRRPDELDSVSWPQVQAIAEHMPERLRIAVWLAATCGLRLGEVLGLQRRDVDVDQDGTTWLHVRRQWLTKARPPRYADPKVGSARLLAVPDFVAAMLTAHLKDFVQDAPEAPLIASPTRRTMPLAQSSFDREWRRAREAIAPDLHFHSLRHAALTAYNQAGGTTADTMHRGGHTSLQVAHNYQSVTATRDREITDRLDGAIRKELGY